MSDATSSLAWSLQLGITEDSRLASRSETTSTMEMLSNKDRRVLRTGIRAPELNRNGAGAPRPLRASRPRTSGFTVPHVDTIPPPPRTAGLPPENREIRFQRNLAWIPSPAIRHPDSPVARHPVQPRPPLPSRIAPCPSRGRCPSVWLPLGRYLWQVGCGNQEQVSSLTMAREERKRTARLTIVGAVYSVRRSVASNGRTKLNGAD